MTLDRPKADLNEKKKGLLSNAGSLGNFQALETRWGLQNVE